MTLCCAECGEEEGGVVSLKACMSCMLVKYCNANCQRNHWKKHKKVCKRRAAELRDEALFKDPPPKEDCPICFLPMPFRLICCISLPPATITSVPIGDFAVANDELAKRDMETYYTCCGKSICGGCVHSFIISGNGGKCPFCKAEVLNITEEEANQELMQRVEANDANAMFVLANRYYDGLVGLQQNRAKAIELWKRASKLGSSLAHFQLAVHYGEGGDLMKEKLHYEAAAMAGNEVARYNLGCKEEESGDRGRAVRHWTIAASAGNHNALYNLLVALNEGSVSRNEINSTLTAYNNSCAEMRSEARDAFIHLSIDRIDGR